MPRPRFYRIAILFGVLALGPALLGADDGPRSQAAVEFMPCTLASGARAQAPRMVLAGGHCGGHCGDSCRCAPFLCEPDCACCGKPRDGEHGQHAEQRKPRGPSSAKVGGRIAPDGKTEIQIDLPGYLHRRNTASFGLGLCVFTSIHHSAVWQNVPLLQEFPKYLIDKRVAGGGWPGKVADLIKRKAKEAGVAEPDYVQVEGNEIEILKLACATGRMPAVTYSFSPTGRYGGGRISHMVSLAHADDSYFAVLDNNYIGETNYEWMSPDEFRKTYTGGRSGWAVILLDSGPPPPPHN